MNLDGGRKLEKTFEREREKKTSRERKGQLVGVKVVCEITLGDQLPYSESCWKKNEILESPFLGILIQ